MAYIGGDERNRIRSLAKTNPADAVTAARAVESLWNRVQSLAIAAWYLDDAKEASAVAHEALRIAGELGVPNRTVSVSAWPLRVLIARDRAAARHETSRLLAVIASEPNPVRRADALILVLTAVFEDDSSRNAVLRTLVDSCTSTRAWKASWVLYRAVLMIATVSPEHARTVAGQIPDERRKRRAIRELESGATPQNLPELFWWAGEGT